MPLDDPGRGGERLRESAHRDVGGDDEPRGAEDQMDERAGDRGDDPRAPARHEDVRHVHVERRHEAVQEGEPELAHAPAIVDAGEAVDDLVERHAGEKQELHGHDAQHRAAAEAVEDVAHLARELDRGGGAEESEPDAGDDRDTGEQEEPAPAVEALEEPVHVEARDPDALEAGQRQLERPRDAPATMARQRLAQAGPRLQRQELRVLELVDEVRNDVEVELAVLQHVRGRHLLERRGAVHLVPQEALRRGEQQVAVRRPVFQDEVRPTGHDPRADLGDLEGAGVDAARTRVDVPDQARDLAKLEVLFAVAANQQLELRRRRAVGHRASTSRPVASSPQRVASATCNVERRRRSMKTCTIA